MHLTWSHLCSVLYSEKKKGSPGRPPLSKIEVGDRRVGMCQERGEGSGGGQGRGDGGSGEFGE